MLLKKNISNGITVTRTDKKHSERLRTKYQQKDLDVLIALELLYPDARTELTFKNEFELIVAVILSAQCTDKKVNEVTPALFAKYPDFGALAKAKEVEVAAIIRQVNYYITKSKNIIKMAEKVCAEFNAMLPRNRDLLVTLPGVGRKTANVLLGELGEIPAIAVDTHVFRLSHRLGFSKGKNPLKVEDDLMKKFPPEKWRQVHHSLVLHGRRVCKAQRPDCERCEVKELCQFYKKNCNL
jgi:endonuclease III